jgi:hypothetical protein
VLVAFGCWIADMIGIFSIAGVTAFGGGPLDDRQELASRFVRASALLVALALFVAFVALAMKRALSSWWAVGSLATAMAALTTVALALAGPIAGSGQCLKRLESVDCAVPDQIGADHVAGVAAAAALMVLTVLCSHRARSVGATGGLPVSAHRGASAEESSGT